MTFHARTQPRPAGRTRHGRRTVAALLAVLVLGTVTCSGSSDDDAASSTTSPPDPATAAGAGDEVVALPGLGDVTTPQYAGYASVTDQPCADVGCTGNDEAGLFYWFVGRDDDPGDNPTILWTNGGPGATSFWGFFTENGPYVVGDDGELTPRPQAWNETANYLIFDHPLGVGLSFADDDQLPNDVQEGVDQWYQALVHVLEQHPEIAEQPLYLAGESYGGTYTPLLAQAILDGNAAAGREVVRLGGVIIVAGWVDPVVQQSMDTTFAFTHGLITADDKARLDAVYEQCRAAVAAESPSSAAANDTCSQIKSGIQDISGLYLLNIAAAGDPPTDPVTDYLNRNDVRDAIHAPRDGEFAFYAEAIGDRYVVGEQDSYRGVVQGLLDEGVPIVVISGLNDATDVNVLGTGAWLDLLEGPAADEFHAAATTPWQADGDDAVLGYVQAGGGLTWVKVLNAGHLAVADQPLLIDLLDERLLTPGG